MGSPRPEAPILLLDDGEGSKGALHSARGGASRPRDHQLGPGEAEGRKLGSRADYTPPAARPSSDARDEARAQPTRRRRPPRETLAHPLKPMSSLLPYRHTNST